MTITNIAEKYLEAFFNNTEIEGGLAFREGLSKLNLDYSPQSLTSIDTLLDNIRILEFPNEQSFLNTQKNINLLYLLAFYVGKVVAIKTGKTIEWYQYDEVLKFDPAIKIAGPAFFSSIICILGGISHTRTGTLFLPLNAIATRLFEGPHEKSVAFSAEGIIVQITQIGSQAAL